MSASQTLSSAHHQESESVYFFGTCLIDVFYPEAGLSAIEILQKQNLTVIFPQNQTCCGQAARNCGYNDEAREVAYLQILCFPKNIPIIVPSGSCAGMMKLHYPQLFEGTQHHQLAIDFASRIYEFTAFLVHVLNIKLYDKGEPTSVTWHSSCHALREMNVKDEPLSLIKQLDNVTFIDSGHSQECCGFGGTFSIRQPKISQSMASDKVSALEATKADEFITGDVGCLMNINGTAEKNKASIKGRHIAEFIWERCYDS